MAEHITMYRGDDQTFPFTLTQGGVAVDLTAATVVFSARAALDDETPTLTLSTTDGDITILPDQATTGKGKITVTVPAADSIDLDTVTYLADIQVTESGGAVWTWPEAVYGESTLIRLRIKGDVTRP